MQVQKENTMSRYHKLLSLTAITFSLLLVFQAPVCADPSYKNNPYYEMKITTKVLKKTSLATIKVTGKSGYYCNTLYHWKLSLESTPGIILHKKVLKNSDAKQFKKDAVIFEVPYVSGPNQKISATLKFSVCNEKQCLIEKVALSW
jgi:hypothetical protein